jgi:transposase
MPQRRGPNPKRRGLKPIPRPPAAELRRLYVTERHSLDTIGFHYGVSKWTVNGWLRKARIGRRQSGWAKMIPAERLHALYVTEGLTIEQIARRERADPNTVWLALKYHHIPRRPQGRQVSPPPHTAELRRLYLVEQRSIRQLAGKFSVSYATMRNWLSAAGIPLRPRGGHGPARF